MCAYAFTAAATAPAMFKNNHKKLKKILNGQVECFCQSVLEDTERMSQRNKWSFITESIAKDVTHP